jgi:membrane-bound serine protease (ClpP class)
MPDAGVLATILLIVGLFLLALELMIPSFGIIGIGAGICLLISAWSAWQAWWGTSPGFFWTYVAFWMLGIPGVLVGMLWVMQFTRVGDGVVLRGPKSEAAKPVARDTGKLQALVGRAGKALSLLTPGGMVLIDGERFHAESPGMVIEPGSDIEVIGVRGTRLLVRVWLETEAPPPKATDSADAIAAAGDDAVVPNDTEQQPESEPKVARTEGDTEGDPLDFEIPENYTAG